VRLASSYFNLHNRPKPGRRWRRSPNTTSLSSPSPTLLHAFVLSPELLPPFPSVKPMDATTLSQDYGRDCKFRPSLYLILHTRTPLHPAALASVPYGVVLVRVRVMILSATGRGAGLGLRGPGGGRPPRLATTAAAAVFV